MYRKSTLPGFIALSLLSSNDYFDYYRPYHAFWTLYGIDLPDEVLKTVYFANALRITKALPQAGWPK